MLSPPTKYAEDRLWSDAHIDQVKQIVGPHLVECSPFEIDTKEATDLIVLQNKFVRIACRLRRPGYERQYAREFTIRSDRSSGVRTELAKIIDGWGNWFFYGHVHERGHIHLWWLLDLAIFRATLIRRSDHVRCHTKPNRDGTTTFLAYEIDSFPKSLVIACSDNLHKQGKLELA